MSSSEIRTKAREILANNWGKVALIMLIQGAITYAVSLISNLTGGLLSLAFTICSVPMEYGIYMSYMKIKNNEKVESNDFLKDGFKNFGRSWGIVGNTLLKMWPWLLGYFISIIVMFFGIVMTMAGAEEDLTAVLIFGVLILVFSIIALLAVVVWMCIRGLLYNLSNYIAVENPEMSTKDAVAESERLMRGNRAKLFVLDLSFIGWLMLCILTLGIGSLWLSPYMSMSEIVFYDMLKEKNPKVEVITEK